jgi:hypothetical protein
MVFTKIENPVASAALTHAVFERELFRQCFKEVTVSQVNGSRPFVEVYATCTGSCKMTAEDRRKHPGFSTRSAAKEFDPAKHLVGALKNLVSKHKF